VIPRSQSNVLFTSTNITIKLKLANYTEQIASEIDTIVFSDDDLMFVSFAVRRVMELLNLHVWNCDTTSRSYNLPPSPSFSSFSSSPVFNKNKEFRRLLDEVRRQYGTSSTQVVKMSIDRSDRSQTNQGDLVINLSCSLVVAVVVNSDSTPSKVQETVKTVLENTFKSGDLQEQVMYSLNHINKIVAGGDVRGDKRMMIHSKDIVAFTDYKLKPKSKQSISKKIASKVQEFDGIISVAELITLVVSPTVSSYLIDNIQEPVVSDMYRVIYPNLNDDLGMDDGVDDSSKIADDEIAANAVDINMVLLVAIIFLSITTIFIFIYRTFLVKNCMSANQSLLSGSDATTSIDVSIRGDAGNDGEVVTSRNNIRREGVDDYDVVVFDDKRSLNSKAAISPKNLPGTGKGNTNQKILHTQRGKEGYFNVSIDDEEFDEEEGGSGGKGVKNIALVALQKAIINTSNFDRNNNNNYSNSSNTDSSLGFLKMSHSTNSAEHEQQYLSTDDSLVFSPITQNNPDNENDFDSINLKI
jgi:hypothetical protein